MTEHVSSRRRLRCDKACGCRRTHRELKKQHALGSDLVSILLWRILKYIHVLRKKILSDSWTSTQHLNPNTNGEIILCGSILLNLEQTGILGWWKLAYGLSAAIYHSANHQLTNSCFQAHNYQQKKQEHLLLVNMSKLYFSKKHLKTHPELRSPS